ncbi:MAG: prepilin peptidase [Euryarchaeota archaeon]|nr:prepilin peptidase [Euryarchaeota archaeon]
MEIELVAIFLALLGVSVGAYTDFKKGIIPNTVTLPLIGCGITLHLIKGYLLLSWQIAVSGVIGAGIAFAFGYLFWLAGGWGGGDVKLITALGALLPVYPSSLKNMFLPIIAPYSSNYPAFAITIFLNSIFGIFPLILAYVVYVCIKRPNLLKEMIQPFKTFRKYVEVPIVLIAAGMVGALAGRFFNSNLFYIIALFLSVALFLVPSLLRLVISAPITAYTFFKDPLGIGVIFIRILAFVLGIALLIKGLSVLRENVLKVEIPITDLKEGAISAEWIYMEGELVKKDVGFSLSALKQAIEKRDFIAIKSLFRPKVYEKILANPRVAAGLTAEEIDELQKLVKSGKLENRIKIKKGIPFGPSILLGLLISIIFGDIFWWLISR